MYVPLSRQIVVNVIFNQLNNDCDNNILCTDFCIFYGFRKIIIQLNRCNYYEKLVWLFVGPLQ